MSYEDGMPAGGNGRFRGYPARMSERQQLALLLQMTSQEMVSGGNRSESTGPNNTNTSRSSTLQQQRGSKGRWTNKNGESSVQSSIGRKEDFRVRPVLVNGYDLNTKEAASDIPGANSPNESSTTCTATTTTTTTTTTTATATTTTATTTTTTTDSPNRSPQIENADVTPVITTIVSTTTTATTTTTTNTTVTSSNEQQEQQQSSSSLYQQHYNHHSQYQHQQQQRTTGSASIAAPHVAEDSGAPCEMRRTPPQNKVDRSGTGQSGSSPRVTLRLNQVRGARDEKKGGTSNSRQGAINAQSQGQMESSSKMPLSGSSAITNVSGSNGSGNASSSADNGDVYEFKSSKEPTPVRGTSSSPNPNPEKDKENGKALSGQIGQNNGNNTTTTGGSTTTTTDSTAASSTSDDPSTISSSPSTKRAFEGDNADDQDEENRRKKRKDTENVKDGVKSTPTGRQSTGRNATNAGEKCTKSGKQNSNTVSGKNNQNAASNAADRKSPSTASMASSPKPSNTPVGSTTNTKTAATPVLPESDGEDDRSKSSDSGSAPKVPPLKIVIPQSTTSEQEQGNRNGKNTSNRSHQLPYVVASSNSNDSTDKDQNQSASGTTSPTENGSGTKVDDKKDFTGTLHSEERSTHHQRVLRSSHRTGNGNNGSTASKEVSGSSAGNGNYSNSSPLPVATTDRSNNSSPQQRHHSPPPENTNSESNKPASAESSNTGTITKTNTATEKSEKNTESTGKNQKDTGVENSENNTTAASSAASSTTTSSAPVELHPRKRKMKPNKEAQQAAATAAANEAAEANNTGPEVHPHDQPITNCYQLFLNIRKQIERRRKGLFPVQPKPPQGFKDYLMNRCTYVLAGNANNEPNVNPPVSLQSLMKDLYIEQEKERYRLRMQHVVEKEKLVLSVEQEILRVHGRAARALANQSLPFSVCTILKDEEVYNVITPEQEEKDRNARSRYNGRLFLSWLQDVDDKWEKIKEAMLLRHHNEAESLHAVQKMDWEWKLKEVGLCEFKATPQIEDVHVPMVHVSDDFDLLPA
uniref:ankyrin repeat domain-containing protein 12 n=1 Tax=Vespula vulgaris TaxID=7454 RepID=UPI0021379CD7|nr:ankyrin repeat domain-containing protein 12 [Vespula vulgaris]XP_050853088.1 ankyrin repeat domain-containing protein 12 [Vespula vulgaris]